MPKTQAKVHIIFQGEQWEGEKVAGVFHRDQGENWWAMPKDEDESAISEVWLDPTMLHEMYHSFDE